MSNIKFNQESAATAVTVTPSDSAANAFSMLYVGTTGDVVISDAFSNKTTFKNVPAGQYIAVRTSLVWATNTTASNIVGIG